MSLTPLRIFVNMLSVSTPVRDLTESPNTAMTIGCAEGGDGLTMIGTLTVARVESGGRGTAGPSGPAISMGNGGIGGV